MTKLIPFNFHYFIARNPVRPFLHRNLDRAPYYGIPVSLMEILVSE